MLKHRSALCGRFKTQSVVICHFPSCVGACQIPRTPSGPGSAFPRYSVSGKSCGKKRIENLSMDCDSLSRPSLQTRSAAASSGCGVRGSTDRLLPKSDHATGDRGPSRNDVICPDLSVEVSRGQQDAIESLFVCKRVIKERQYTPHEKLVLRGQRIIVTCVRVSGWLSTKFIGLKSPQTKTTQLDT